MTTQEILKKAIQKAIDGGWHGEVLGKLEVISWFNSNKVNLENNLGEEWSMEEIIFNHDFAKALVGTDMQNGQPRWKNFLSYLVVQDDPIQALEKFL